MTRMKIPFPHNLMLFLSFLFICNCSNRDKQLNVLILSGRNNHDWEKTTPVLKTTFEESGLFRVDVTNRPDTMNYKYFTGYDALVSNWNSWPENDLRWPEEAENGLLRYIERGGGMVFFHASTSAFYAWPEFKRISTGAWIDDTWHGEMCPVHVSIENTDHPVTRGMRDFWIHDELWFNAEQNDAFQVLGSASKKTEEGHEASAQPAIFTTSYGEGRIFHTILGHDARSLRNTGFRALITRGTEWAATSDVTLPLPRELRKITIKEPSEYSWLESDTTIGLKHQERVVWQYNYNTIRGKPYFHPVCPGGNRMTCLSPDDHIWHLGQWFSWKFIDGINYWEYTGKGYRSEGVTEITGMKIVKNPDFSAEIILDIDYHPPGGEPVLKEHRKIDVLPPQKERICMDYSMEFVPVADSVDINRTPIAGEPDGKSWGGYAGLSIRFNQDLMEASWISSNADTGNVNGTTGDWLYMGFTGLDGNRTGTAMFVPESSKRDGWAWYLINERDLPFYYFSPACLYLKPLMLNKGETLKLNYRILHLYGSTTFENLSAYYHDYVTELNH